MRGSLLGMVEGWNTRRNLQPRFRSDRTEALEQFSRALLRMVAEHRQQFLEQMFAGLNQVRVVGQKFRWHRSAKSKMETPVAFIDDRARNDLRSVPRGQTQRAGR